MNTVQACDGFCMNPDQFTGAAYQLLTIAESREKILKNDPCCDSFNLVNKFELATVSSLVTSMAVHTRLWFDQFYELDPEIPNPNVCVRLDGNSKNRRYKLKNACSFLAHSCGMWFMPFEGKCKGTEIVFAVPDNENGSNRHYSLCLKEFSCGVSQVVNYCPDCAGEFIELEVDCNGLPLVDD